ncbi:DUF4238 domain-containing protein [Sphingopyxis sp. KK2]|uniref:DUF4238 domain-containing protein n=1 Tax=Sphingopyxis sp. KK2 TaxID=1855727 RepID=UPI00097E5F02|nr:DUF4238 domain-containing protein [Sphingopyxis sp. KK2]
MQADPAKHHYVPEFYLREWAGADGRLERYTRPTPKKIAVRRVFPSQMGFSRNLYDSPNEKLLERHWLETRVFQQIDSCAANVFRKLNDEPPGELTGEDVNAWSVFVRAQFYRTPEGLRAVKESGAQEWLAALDAARDRYQELKSISDPDLFEDYVSLQTEGDIERSVLRTLPGIFSSERVVRILNELHYRIMDTGPSVPQFLISDDFLARTNGLLVENGHFAMPISPRRLLVMTVRRETFDRIGRMTDKELVTAVNRWIVESARHFVGATDLSQDRFIRNRFGVDLKRSLSRGDGTSRAKTDRAHVGTS